MALVDKSGAAQFLVNSISAKITGRIPAGQKLTVEGEAYNSSGNNYNGTTINLNGATLVNDGTIVLDAQGSTNKSGGPVVVNDGSIRNAGTILAEVQDPSWNVQYAAGLANTRTGTLSVSGGTFVDTSAAVSNDGTVKLGPEALYLLEGGAAFTNKSDGTIVPQIASSKSFGQFELSSPCCSGPGRFLAGGDLMPAILGHLPAANTEFQLFQLTGGASKAPFPASAIASRPTTPTRPLAPPTSAPSTKNQARRRRAEARPGLRQSSRVLAEARVRYSGSSA